ncbi:MAG TPA: hypothetical protein VFZ27_04655 [Terriglobia bacterium]|nr:hypothetical protein [Terriglobia bacterium]
MAKESQKNISPKEVKKHLEAAAGREIDIPADRLINLWYPTGVHDYTDGRIAWRSIIALFPPRCDSATLLDASGASTTGADGKRVFKLSDVVCLPPQRLLAEPINLLATPRSASPFYVTTEHQLLNPGDFSSDVQLTVHAWDKNGAAAPNVTFDWRCRVVSLPVIL